MLRITTPVTQVHVAAVERATEMARAGHSPRLVARNLYEVPSGTYADVTYRVEVRNLSTLYATCNCPAGSRGRFCKHQAMAICDASRRVSLARVPVPGPSQAKRRLSDAECAARMRQLFATTRSA